MTRRALGGFAAAILLALAGVGFFPRPALAAAPNISFSPADNADLAEPVSITGNATMNNGGWVDSVKVTIASTQGHTVPAPDTTAGNESNNLPFSWKPPLAYNGSYTVTVEAVGRDGPVPRFDESELSTVTRTFTLNVAPVAPSGVKAVVNQTKRTITISWAQNPEPDIVGYGVYRQEGDALVERKIVTPTQTSFTDELGSLPAGTYSYHVFAARSNATGDQVLVSAPATTTGKVTSAPPTTTTSTGGAAGVTTTTAAGNKPPALATRGRTDLSGFAALLPSGGAKLPRASNAPAPDTGFDENLPFDPDARAEDEPTVGDGSDQALAEEPLSSSDDDQPSSLRFMAAGLLVTVVLMHLLWLREEVNRDPLPAIAPEDPVEA
jgi:hypothetical protein